MKHRVLVALVSCLLAGSLNLACQAATVMVSVRADFASTAISPSSMVRAKQMVADIESSFMDEFFNQGHITYNFPQVVRTPKSDAKPLTIDQLLWTSSQGGAEILVYCTVVLEEVKPNQPVHVKDCTVSAIGVHQVPGFPLNWEIPVSATTMETDIKPGIIKVAQEITVHL